jgi:hypothetical protein
MARPRVCWLCGSAAEKLKKCTGCQAALYCSKDCQVAHWKEHKSDCKVWKMVQQLQGV